MSFRASAVRAIGGFDTNYGGTAFLEDTDVSERVRQLGWELRFQAPAEVIHHSAPSGGVRVATPRETERWRFHNTGYFLRRHRPSAAPRAIATFAAIATRRATEWRDPGAVAFLMGAFRPAGGSEGPPCLEPPLDG